MKNLPTDIPIRKGKVTANTPIQKGKATGDPVLLKNKSFYQNLIAIFNSCFVLHLYQTIIQIFKCCILFS